MASSRFRSFLWFPSSFYPSILSIPDKSPSIPKGRGLPLPLSLSGEPKSAHHGFAEAPKNQSKNIPSFLSPQSSQSHPKVRIVEDLGPKMTSKSEPGGYPGELQKPTLYKNLQNSNPTLIYHTSAMSATPQKHQFWSLEATQNRWKNEPRKSTSNKRWKMQHETPMCQKVCQKCSKKGLGFRGHLR